MGNWVDVQVDVLAECPAEINNIELALQQPCDELLAWVSTIWNLPAAEIAADVKQLVTFKTTRNLGAIDQTVNKARRFDNEFKDVCWGVVWSHLHFVSRDYPEAVFLVSYWDISMSHAGKTVFRAGRTIRDIHDGSQQAQGYEWVLPDIFAPYQAEYQTDDDFGVFWDSWLLGMEDAISALKERYGTPKVGTTCDSALLERERKFELAAQAAELGDGDD